MTTRVRAEMPEPDRILRPRGWWVPPAGFAFLAALLFARGFRSALHFDPRVCRAHCSEADWVFPAEELATVAQTMAIELFAIVFACALRVPTPLRLRLVFLALLMTVLGVFLCFPLALGSAPWLHLWLLQFMGAAWLWTYPLFADRLAGWLRIR